MTTLLSSTFFLLASCLNSHHAVVKAPQAMDVAVASVMGFADRREVQPCPEAVDQVLDRVLSEHNLTPHHHREAAMLTAFEARRTTPHRLGWLAEIEPAAPLDLLVETEPRFYSQLSGRYRWTVDVHITLSPRAKPEEALTADVSIPVFLEFYREKEPEALVAASALIERDVSYLLDEYLGGLSATGAAP